MLFGWTDKGFPRDNAYFVITNVNCMITKNNGYDVCQNIITSLKLILNNLNFLLKGNFFFLIVQKFCIITTTVICLLFFFKY